MEFGGDEEAYDYMLLGDHQHERAVSKESTLG